MFSVKFIVIYDGTHFFGWQRQSHHRTVQEEIEKVLSKLFQKKITIHGSGRTDRGVHARGQVVSCNIPETNLLSLEKSLNALLPKDIRVKDFCLVSPDFHARFSAIGKKYKYTVHTKKHFDPFTRTTSYHHPYPLDLDVMKKGAKIFIGTKDFTSVTTEPGKDCIKTIYDIQIEITENGFILTFHGSGFLYKMVRNITGALIDAGEGKVSLKKLEEILEGKNAMHGLKQAPAHGLCLEEVFYSQ